MVTGVPTGPAAGETALIFGLKSTAKVTPLLDWPSTVTTRFPVTAPGGTVTTSLVSCHPEAGQDAGIPPNVTVLFPGLDPKLLPLMVTLLPAGAAAGVTLLIVGAAMPATVAV